MLALGGSVVAQHATIPLADFVAGPIRDVLNRTRSP